MSAAAEYGPLDMRADVVEMAARLRNRTEALTAACPVDAEAVERLRQAYHGLLRAADVLDGGPAAGGAVRA